jgi:ribosome-associated protein
MSPKPHKGYYVEGKFVAAGSAADEQLRNEAETGNSRTQRKHASEKLQQVGESLLTLRPDLFAALPLPENLRDAILEGKRSASFGAKRRQVQLIGKLMRHLDDEALEAVQAALRIEHEPLARDTRLLHGAEGWRDALIARDESLGVWIEAFPDTDVQQLRALIRQARKDAREAKPGQAQRQGRAYRQIFSLLRSQLSANAGVPVPVLPVRNGPSGSA